MLLVVDVLVELFPLVTCTFNAISRAAWERPPTAYTDRATATEDKGGCSWCT